MSTMTATKGLSGITRNGCAPGCSDNKGCVITMGGSGVCGHPRKGGLQAADKTAAILERYAEACQLAGVALTTLPTG